MSLFVCRFDGLLVCWLPTAAAEANDKTGDELQPSTSSEEFGNVDSLAKKKLPSFSSEESDNDDSVAKKQLRGRGLNELRTQFEPFAQVLVDCKYTNCSLEAIQSDEFLKRVYKIMSTNDASKKASPTNEAPPTKKVRLMNNERGSAAANKDDETGVVGEHKTTSSTNEEPLTKNVRPMNKALPTNKARSMNNERGSAGANKYDKTEAAGDHKTTSSTNEEPPEKNARPMNKALSTNKARPMNNERGSAGENGGDETGAAGEHKTTSSTNEEPQAKPMNKVPPTKKARPLNNERGSSGANKYDKTGAAGKHKTTSSTNEEPKNMRPLNKAPPTTKARPTKNERGSACANKDDETGAAGERRTPVIRQLTETLRHYNIERTVGLHEYDELLDLCIKGLRKKELPYPESLLTLKEANDARDARKKKANQDREARSKKGQPEDDEACTWTKKPSPTIGALPTKKVLKKVPLTTHSLTYSLLFTTAHYSYLLLTTPMNKDVIGGSSKRDRKSKPRDVSATRKTVSNSTSPRVRTRSNTGPTKKRWVLITLLITIHYLLLNSFTHSIPVHRCPECKTVMNNIVFEYMNKPDHPFCCPQCRSILCYGQTDDSCFQLIPDHAGDVEISLMSKFVEEAPSTVELRRFDPVVIESPTGKKVEGWVLEKKKQENKDGRDPHTGVTYVVVYDLAKKGNDIEEITAGWRKV